MIELCVYKIVKYKYDIEYYGIGCCEFLCACMLVFKDSACVYI